MAQCAPQRFLANNRNQVRTAVLTPSSVQAVSDSVLETQIGRTGTAQVALTGAYTGTEAATYDVEIIDNSVTTQLISAPVFAGAGSGSLSGITSSTAAQMFTVQLADAGIPTTTAAVDFEGVRIVAKAAGATGNLLSMSIDQAGLTYGTTTYSLLEDIKAGAGSSTSALFGAGFDWDTKVLGADNIIPATAHRVSFGDDKALIYLQFKEYLDGKWNYRFVPSLARDVPKGTKVYFVTGGRSVAVTDGTTTRTYTSIVTHYDLLNALRTDTSGLVAVDGVVANDRSPTGQAANELLVRTDAHVEPSTGSGGHATGFEDTFANSGAATELVTARCFATTSKDNPLARIGAELWEVTGSVSGALANATTGVPYSTANFGFTIPQKVPAGFGGQKGRFSVTDINYVGREVDIEPPQICVVAMLLGPEVTDQSIRLKYTKRPSGDCLCDGMPVPNLNTDCLGNITEGGGTVGYSAGNLVRLKDLYDWYADTVRSFSAYEAAYGAGQQAPFLTNPATNPSFITTFSLESLKDVVSRFETTLLELDGMAAGTDKTNAETSWDTAETELKSDVATFTSAPPPSTIGQSESVQADEALAAGNTVSVYINNAGLPRARKGISSLGVRWGFVTAAVTSGATAVVYHYGVATGLTGIVSGTQYGISSLSAGVWEVNGDPGYAFGYLTSWGISATEISVPIYPPYNQVAGTSGSVVYWWNLLSDRYKSRLNWVLAMGNISPLGKTDASIEQSGDGCWRDWGDPFYWEVVGANGAYANAFTNHPYYLARKAGEAGKFFSTKEAAFQINVKCPEGLLVDDEIVLTIGDAGWPATYTVGDLLTLPIIATQPLYLAGGQNGSAIQTWYVNGTVAGPLANFSYNPASPAPYSNGGLAFTLNIGGIPFAKGDKFVFATEGGHYRWRKDAGTWSSSLNIPAVLTAFDSGLSILFTPGAAPSFVALDTYSFRALQPWAVSNVAFPTPGRWQWTGAAPTLIADFGSAQTQDMVALALHTLPAGTTITLDGGVTAGVYTWTDTLTWQAGVIVKQLAATQTSRYIRITLGAAGSGGIGLFWAGMGLSTILSAETQLRRAYKIERANSGLYQGGVYLGKTVSGEVLWTEGALSDADIIELTAMLDWIKENDDEPFVYVPQVTRPAEALLARVVLDEVELTDVYSYGPDAGKERRFSARLPLEGVWQ